MAEPPGPETRPPRSVRYRILAIALVPMLVLLPLMLGLAILRWNAKFEGLLRTKVNSDLTIAQQYLSTILDETAESLRALGASANLKDVLESGNRERLMVLLDSARRERGLDYLAYMRLDGEVMAASPLGASLPGPDWPVIAAARAGRPASAIDCFTAETLNAISPDLAERANLPLIETENAAPTDRSAETRGMVIHSASPVAVEHDEALLVGGMLLNRNLAFIDTINDLVYRSASLPEGSHGTATLFLDDVRVSTNVRLFEGERALGTRVSAAVRQSVLGEGRTWLDSAFVVNDWYISGYEPIVDSFGERVGMLYVGFLEAPFRAARLETLTTIAVAFLLATVLTVPLFLHWARAIFEPLERMSATIRRVESGDLGARTGPTRARDEIGQAARLLDHLLDQLEARDRELRSWNETLNSRVEERTHELMESNRQLEITTRQLVMREKLASIGEIAAGVAHEINNPVAVIQGNLEVARALLGDAAAPARREFALIDEQTERISEIIFRLLQFARPDEYGTDTSSSLPEQIVDGCLPLVRHLMNRSKIEVVRCDRSTREVQMPRTELQQVLVNLIVNAIHAMPSGGTLTLTSADLDKDGRPGVALSVADTGVGMKPEVLARIFDPFFTTKAKDGTGLGLSISHMLVSRRGGDVAAESAPGVGSRFIVWLPGTKRPA
ncbi:sensor histidine kinase [Acuticoccus mangrovi]|uniref:histidine kinase n=1 Tax=Acuticoccus mangrovi TaxID=2796142 RepID=A0A934IRK7_9HYPH|nr:HAMP domain-containing sensor histidine kinase [Acuticoccus mangrovi]MBJ3776962.1 cache domain-containing protein [Acuticoccus mangrovi]